MFINNLKIVLRHIFKNKVYFAIDAIGLAIGITFFMMVLHSITYDLSFEKYNKNRKNVYRVVTDGINNDSKKLMATCCPGLGPILKNECPEIEDYARFTKESGVVTNIINNTNFNEIFSNSELHQRAVRPIYNNTNFKCYLSLRWEFFIYCSFVKFQRFGQRSKSCSNCFSSME